MVVIVALALGLALAIQAWIVKPYQIPSESMEPTLDVGQRVLVNRFIYHFTDPSIGDIVVFHPPAGADNDQAAPRNAGVQPKIGEPCPQPTAGESSQNFIKRIVAVPGDTLSVKEGHPVVNGVEKKDEPYIIPCGSAGRLQHAADDHDSTRPLLHDGRQPWSQRRQPLLGTRPSQPGSSVRPLPPTGHPTASASSKPKSHRRRLARSRRLFAFDRGLQSRFVAGADEAGRGCLAGPLVAAAVLIDYERLSHADRRALAGLHDSKQMTGSGGWRCSPACCGRPSGSAS